MFFNVGELISQFDLDPELEMTQNIINEILATKQNVRNDELPNMYCALNRNFKSWNKPFPYYFARAMYLDLHLKYPQHMVISISEAMDTLHPQ